MKSPLASIKKRKKSIGTESSLSVATRPNPLANAPEISPVRSKRNDRKFMLEDDTEETNESEDEETDLVVPQEGSFLSEEDSASKSSIQEAANQKAEKSGNKTATNGANDKNNQGILSGFLTAVGNQISSITSPTDEKRTGNLINSFGPNSLSGAPNDSTEIQDDKKPQDKVHDKGQLSISDIQFRAVKNDEPLRTLGKGNLLLSDFGGANRKRESGKSLLDGNGVPLIGVNIDDTKRKSVDTLEKPTGQEPQLERNFLVVSNRPRLHSPLQLEENLPRLLPEVKVSSGTNLKPTEMSPLSSFVGLDSGVEDSRKKQFLSSPKRSSFIRVGSINGGSSLPTSRSNSQSRVENKKDKVRLPGDFSFASERKQREFHATFKKLDPDEKLLQDYVCALSKDILLQGKLYVSLNYISFNSNILGWVTNVSIRLEEIVQIEKRSTAGFIPNAMSIQTLHQRYLFTSLISRDVAFDFITTLWNKSIRGVADSGQISRVSSELGSFDDEGETSSGYNTDSGLSDSEMENISDMDNMTSGSDDDLDADLTEKKDLKEEETAQVKDKDKDKDKEKSKEPDSSEGSGDLIGLGPAKHAPTKSPWQKKSNETEIQTVTFDAPVGVVVQLLFGENTEFYKSLIAKQKNIEISDIPSFSANSNGVEERKYNFIKPLTASLGPKQTKCIVTEIIEKKDIENEGLVQVLQSTQSPDVPSGGAFLVYTRFYVTWAENNQTQLQVITYIDWTGKSWIKSAIESGTISGQKESIGILVNTVNAELASKSNKKGGSNKKTKRTKSKKSKPRPEIKSESPEAATSTQSESMLLTIVSTVSSLIPSYLKLPLLITIALVASITLGSRILYQRDPYSDLDDVSNFQSHGQLYTVIPPLHTIEGNTNLRNQLQAGIWDWVEEKVTKDPEGPGDVIEAYVGKTWRDKYYEGQLTESQKEYLKDMIRERKLQLLSKKSSKKELEELVRLSQMRLNQLKQNIQDIDDA